MILRGPRRLPPATAPVAFRSAAPHARLTQAAPEPGTPPSAASRHIRHLQASPPARPFDGSRTVPARADAGDRSSAGVLAGPPAVPDPTRRHRGRAVPRHPQSPQGPLAPPWAHSCPDPP